MHTEIPVSLSALFGFLLVLVRMSGVFIFFPMPGAHAGGSPARVVLALGCTMALYAKWPDIRTEITPGLLAVWVFSEAALGLMAGVAVSFIAEALVLGAQVLSLQAGYAYASTIDPATNADSGILLVFAQLLAGLLFFAVGLDRQIIAAMAASLDTYPPGQFANGRAMAAELIRLAGAVFATAVRLAMPVIALLAMVDIAVALLGRVSPHLQVLSIAFPLKLLVSLLVLSSILLVFPTLYGNYSNTVMTHLCGMLMRP